METPSTITISPHCGVIIGGMVVVLLPDSEEEEDCEDPLLSDASDPEENSIGDAGPLEDEWQEKDADLLILDQLFPSGTGPSSGPSSGSIPGH